MEATEQMAERLRKSIDKDKGEVKSARKSSIASAYIPQNLDYISSTNAIQKSLPSFEVTNDNSAIASHAPTTSALSSSAFHFSLPKEIQGTTGTYELIYEIRIEEAKGLQAQTGLVISFEPGKENTAFIGNKGYFGQLRLGKEEKSGRYVGIKEIKGDKVKESLEEAKIQKKLTGLPYLMPLIEAIEGEEKGNKVLYHIMPLAALGNGKELASYLAQIKDISFKEALLVHVAKCVLKGFEGIQSKNIAHLDFKPDNLVVDATGNGLVIDYGCAKELEEGYVKGRNLGDIRYYAPERQASPEYYLGKTQDCYTIGLSLLELAVGRIAHQDKKAKDYLNHPYLQEALPLLPTVVN